MDFDELDRDVRALRLPDWGRVAASDVLVPFVVVDAEGVAVEPIRRFLREFVAQDQAAGSVRSYAFDLLRWWRFLRVHWRGVGPGRRGGGPRLRVVAAAGEHVTPSAMDHVAATVCREPFRVTIPAPLPVTMSPT